MKDFDPATILAVVREMFGAWLWLGVAAFAAVIVLYVLVATGRGTRGRAASLIALAAGIVAGVVAAFAALSVTDSRYSDLNGPVDLAAFALVVVLAGMAVAIAVWPVGVLVSRPPGGTSGGRRRSPR